MAYYGCEIDRSITIATPSQVPTEEWGKKLKNLLYDYGTACSKADKGGDIKARKEEGVELNKVVEHVRSLLSSHTQNMKEKAADILRKKADAYNNSWGVDTCAALIAAAIQIEDL